MDKVYSTPLEMAAEHKPTKVMPNTEITIQFAKKPIKESLSIEQWTSVKDSKKIELKNNKLTVPAESGVYVYHISANWKQGDGNYDFSIEVE
ncbi:hypothetical protein FITA111629_14370 [Filibacter tadaridae]|uniref:YtkA-like domain-containing protein n=1 Tax=Filibacter tadaridae TaxID=2483811 RepID=A0A3P5WQM4_9BACL|nr:hypothetical protein [Filibacter tadaridae]VDC24008.1 hypothetical protein FILTAD_00973 [Filibacter tadaridae]